MSFSLLFLEELIQFLQGQGQTVILSEWETHGGKKSQSQHMVETFNCKNKSGKRQMILTACVCVLW